MGSKQHKGFVNTFNFIVDFFKHIKDYIPVGINNRSGNMYIVAGKGIDVKTEDHKITISFGEGKTEDDNSGTNPNGSGDGDGAWYPPPQVEDGKVSMDSGMFKWDSEDKSIGVGGCMVGRKWYTCTSGTGSGKADGTYQLQVTIGSGGGVSLAVVMDSTIGKEPTTTQCWIPIYEIVDGEIENDYRGAFVVPAYE